MSFYEQVLRVKDAERFPMVLVGNKIDMAEQRCVRKEEGEILARSLGVRCFLFISSHHILFLKQQIPFFEVSAKVRINIDEIFITAAQIGRSNPAKIVLLGISFSMSLNYFSYLLLREWRSWEECIDYSVHPESFY
jgi:GTPase SAR1 family protein